MAGAKVPTYACCAVGTRGRYARRSYRPVSANGQAFKPPRYWTIGGVGKDNRIDAAIDNLRLSDVRRYTHEFVPPPRESEFRVDAHTRLLLLFNGTVEAVTAGSAEPVTVKFMK